MMRPEHVVGRCHDPECDFCQDEAEMRQGEDQRAEASGQAALDAADREARWS